MGACLNSDSVQNGIIQPKQKDQRQAAQRHEDKVSKSSHYTNNEAKDNSQKVAQLQIGADGKYVDQDFPPNSTSLIKDWNNYNQDDCRGWDQLQWKRLSDIEEVNKDGQICVFQNQVTPNDILQGSLGDCYYLSSLSALAENEQRIKKIFEHHQAVPEGIYTVNITKNGKKVQITVDDHVPVDKDGSIVFSKAQGNEIWVVLMEKAWAKIHGSYEIIISGHGSLTLRDITGAPSFDYDVKDDETWDRILNANNNGHIILSSTKQGNKDVNYDNLGLVAGHEYAILQCAVVNSSQGAETKILQLRNPWGNFEWKGDWSDNSDCWTEEAKQQIGLTIADDGSFCIDFEEFRKYYDQISICELNDSYLFSCMNQGLNFNESQYKIIKLDIQNTGDYTLGVSQKDKRCCDKDNGYKYQSVRAIIVKPNDENILNGLQFLKNVKSNYERDTYLKLESLEKGTYYVLVHPELDESSYVDQPEFYINAYGPSNVTFSDETLDLQNLGFSLQDFVEHQILSRLQLQSNLFQLETISQDDAPNIESYIQDIDDGYYYYIIKNNESDKTLKQDVRWDLSDKMEIMPVSQNSSKFVSVQDGKVVHIESTPGSTAVTILKIPIPNGYSVSYSYTYRVS